MTYGFEVKNASGQIVANDTDFNWGLYMEGSLTGAGSVVTGIVTTKVMPLVFFRAPTSRRNIFLKMDRFLNPAVSLTFWVPTFTIEDTATSVGDPVETIYYRIYMPMNEIETPSGETYGIRVRDVNGNVTFDSRLKPAFIEQILTLNYEVWNGDASTLANAMKIAYTALTPANSGVGTPWIGSTDVYDAGVYKGMYYNGSQRYRFDTHYFNRNNNIGGGYAVKQVHVPYTSGPVYWNNNSGVSHVVFVMPGTDTPLNAWVNKDSGGTASCSYTTGSCSTSETFWTEWTGGNSSPVTHSWQLIGGNAASFSLSYPYSNGVTVSLNNAVAGNYSTTLRYTLSQTGSTSVVIDTPISRLHSIAGTIVSPLTCQNTTFSDAEYGSVYARLYINSDGTWSAEGSSSGNLGGGYWYGSSPTPNIGANYSVFFTKTSGTGTATSTSWQSLSTSKFVTTTAVTTSSLDVNRVGTYQVQIRNDSTMTIVSNTVGIKLSAFAIGQGGVAP